MNKNFTLLLVLFFTITTFGANAQVLKWAADAEGNAPYIFQDPNNPGKVIGFELDIANAIAAELGWTAQHVQNQWDGLIAGLDRRDYDAAINGLEITPDRAEKVNFSIPYYVTYEQLVVRASDYKYAKLIDFKGKSVGALKGSLAERILKNDGGIDVKTYEGEVNSFEDLKNGRIEAVLVDAPIALYYASWNKDLRLLNERVGEVVYGVALRKSDSALTQKINYAINQIINNGKLRNILESWNLWNPVLAEKFGDKSFKVIPAAKYMAFIKAQSGEKNWFSNFEKYISVMPMFASAALVTLGLSVVAMSIAIILGMFVAVLRVYGNKVVSRCATLYIETIRGTPLLVQLFFIFYALPGIGIKFSPFLAAIIGLGLNYSAYEAENYRAGLFAVPKGQMEAALSLGLNRWQALRQIILPQAFRLVIPPITNDFISLLKDSSLVSVITMVELTKVYNQTAATYYDFFGMGIITAFFYLILGLPFVKIAKKAEEKLRKEQVRTY
jgi:polar amino acid transport system substrate-binding protein